MELKNGNEQNSEIQKLRFTLRFWFAHHSTCVVEDKGEQREGRKKKKRNRILNFQKSVLNSLSRTSHSTFFSGNHSTPSHLVFSLSHSLSLSRAMFGRARTENPPMRARGFGSKWPHTTHQKK